MEGCGCLRTHNLDIPRRIRQFEAVNQLSNDTGVNVRSPEALLDETLREAFQGIVRDLIICT